MINKSEQILTTLGKSLESCCYFAAAAVTLQQLPNLMRDYGHSLF